VATTSDAAAGVTAIGLPHVMQLPIAVPPLCWLPVIPWLPLPLALLSHHWYVEPAGITVA